MKFAVVILLVLLTIPTNISPQTFDGREGFIFEQSYVTRITESDAAVLINTKDAGELFLNLYEKKDKTTVLPKGVVQFADRLIFQAAGKTDLSFKNYVYQGKDDSGDSQRFSYLSEFGKYHLVVVTFDHDRPCFMLVDKDTLKVYFVNYDTP